LKHTQEQKQTTLFSSKILNKSGFGTLNSDDIFTFTEEGIDIQGTKEACSTIQQQSRAATNNAIF
jgi:hypothetical protein